MHALEITVAPLAFALSHVLLPVRLQHARTRTRPLLWPLPLVLTRAPPRPLADRCATAVQLFAAICPWVGARNADGCRSECLRTRTTGYAPRRSPCTHRSLLQLPVVPCRPMSCRVVPCRTVSSRVVPCRPMSCMRAQSFDHVLRGLLWDRNFLIVMGSSAAILISCVLGRSSKNFGTNGTSRWQVKLMHRSITSGKTCT